MLADWKLAGEGRRGGGVRAGAKGLLVRGDRKGFEGGGRWEEWEAIPARSEGGAREKTGRVS